MLNKLYLIALFLLTGRGLYAALSVSYNTLSNTAPCPDIVGFPICYIVTIAYFAMVLGLLLNKAVHSTKLFLSGWFVVFAIAVIGSAFEITTGNVCPVSEHNTPLCYLSLLLCTLIFIFFQLRLAQKRRRAQNNII